MRNNRYWRRWKNINNSNFTMYITENRLTKWKLPSTRTRYAFHRSRWRYDPSGIMQIYRDMLNNFIEGESKQQATVAKSATIQMKGIQQISRDIASDHLDVMISVGHCTRSLQGTQSRTCGIRSLEKGFQRKGGSTQP